MSDIDHESYLVKHLSELYVGPNVSQEYSDVVIVVDGQKFHLHKVVLAMRSTYFHSLLYGGMKESKQSEIILYDVSPEAFTYLIQYIYTGRIPLTNLHTTFIIKILVLANQYGFHLLKMAIYDELIKILTVSNVCSVFNDAHIFNLCKLVDACNQFLDSHATEILVHESFRELSQASVIELLGRDSFIAPEINVFCGVLLWCHHTNGDTSDMVTKCVRLSLINDDDLLEVVRPTALVNDSTILEALTKNKSNINCLPHRGSLLLNVNVADASMDAKVVAGEYPECLLDGNSETFTSHDVSRPGDKGIIIKLANNFIINHIRMLLYQGHEYQYFIEVSMNMKDWVRVVNYIPYWCRSWQYLYFDKRHVQYIRIYGLEDGSETFKLVFLEAMCKSEMPPVIDYIVCPDYNVATLDRAVAFGFNEDVLLNGDTQNYTLDAGYTSHTIGTGEIKIGLNQPYVISIMRLLLLDLDARTFSYYIELSINDKDWEMVVDRREEKCRSWQILRFRPRPVQHIRIIGTYSSATKTIQCVHFECSYCAEDL